MERERVWDVVVRGGKTDYLARGPRLPPPAPLLRGRRFISVRVARGPRRRWPQHGSGPA
jgi:hypothetical protein